MSGRAQYLRMRLKQAAAAFMAILFGPLTSAAVQPSARTADVVSVRLISAEQYANTVSAVFGPVPTDSVRLPPMRRTEGLTSVGAGTAVVTPGTLSRFDAMARQIADAVLAPERRAVVMPCRPKSEHASDPACARRFFAQFGPYLFRRPLEKAELDTYARVASEAADAIKDFYPGLSLALAGMLSSPKFIYVTERLESDPLHPGQRRLDGWSRASRLSLLIWDAGPDAELLRAAGKGELHTATGLSRQVERMLASKRVEAGVRAFFSDMLMLDSYEVLTKDPVIYPAFTLRVAGDAREQVLRMVVDHLLVRNGDYRELFTTRHIFLNGDLATIYRIPVPFPEGWQPYELPASTDRAGLLNQVGFLAVNSHAGRSSPTRRGRALRELLLCQKVPDPPPNVDFSIIEDPNAKFLTARDRLRAHSSDPTCAGCHRLTDPIGLAMEKFDGAGQFRTTEKGAALDTSGDLDGAKFADANGLGQALHDSAKARSCLVRRTYSYGLGRPLDKTDNPDLKQLEKQFADEGYRFPALLRSIATSPDFFALGATAAPSSQLAGG